MKFSLKFLLMLVAAVAILILIGSFSLRTFQQHGGVSQTGVSHQTANRYLPSELTLPNQASDVTFHVDFGAAESEFAISEEAFLAWCKSRDWSCSPISTPTTYFEPMHLPADSRPVNRGYTFAPPDGQGVFDSERLRACFRTSTFP